MTDRYNFLQKNSCYARVERLWESREHIQHARRKAVGAVILPLSKRLFCHASTAANRACPIQSVFRAVFTAQPKSSMC